jgi:DNA polymerase-3 subunit epsilon
MILENKCKGACEQKESAENYNAKVQQCIQYIENELPTFALLDDGLEGQGQSCILVEKGRFYGMGYLPADTIVAEIEAIKFMLTPYAENEYIRAMVLQYAERFPAKKVLFHH